MRFSCQDVSVSFPVSDGRVEAISGLTLHLDHGEFVSLVGPSGSGKTTLLRVLAGSLPPDAGAVEHFPDGDGNRRVLMVLQEHNLFPWMTVLENAVFGLDMQGIPRRESELDARVLLARLGLEGWERAYPHQLSLGMKQRVAVIRCFLSRPALMLMDEPFSALDRLTRLTLQEELLALWDRDHHSVLFVTHDVEEALLLSDRVVVLGGAPGRVLAGLPVPFGRPRRQSLTFDPGFLAMKKEISGLLGLDLSTPCAATP